MNSRSVLSESRSQFRSVCLGVDPPYQLKVTYFPFVSASFVIGGRLLWRDVGSALVESKSLSVFIQMGREYFQSSLLSKDPRRANILF